MRTIIAGSRVILGKNIVREAHILSGFTVTTVISGGAKGVDRLGEQYAKEIGVPVEVYEPDWEGQGKKAGYLRNQSMALVADALIAIWDGKSKGTKHMIDIATRKGLKVYVYLIEA
jgi:hypothetical protein